MGQLTRYIVERIDGSGNIVIMTYQYADVVDRRATVYASGVVEDIVYVTRDGVMTTGWQTDGSYEQSTDEGEGHVTREAHSGTSH
jgi:hypothetical protein